MSATAALFVGLFVISASIWSLSSHDSQFARPNDEERGHAMVPCSTPLSRSSSSVSVSFGMRLQAPPYGEISVTSSEEASRILDSRRLAAFAESWSESWPAYREVLQELFSDYDHGDLFEKNQTRLLVEKLVPNKKANDGADLLLRFSFDDTGITWDIFQKGREIVHAQPVF